jgi:uncharacterized membrane-anchored protein
MRKLPHMTLLFWVLKIVATTLGETSGDLVAQTLKVGLPVQVARPWLYDETIRSALACR